MAQATASGGAVFNSTPGTPRVVPDPATDYLLPPAGALSYGSITSPTALFSTTGVATSLVHGDHFEMMHGNELRTITLDRDHTILGNQISTVHQDRHDTVQSNYNQHIIGATQRLHVGATAEHFVDTHSHTHQADRHVEEPETVFHNLNEHLENANKVTMNYGYKTEMVLAKTDICAGVALEYTTAAIEFAVTKVEGTGTVGYEYGVLKAKSEAAEAKVGVLRAEMDATKGRLSEAELNIQALFETPFALGIYI